jgi:hypothetical protein
MNDTVDPIERITRLSFSKTRWKHQLAWDSTSLSALKLCPRYYYYNIIMGYVTRAENTHLRWGTEYNNALVTYNRLKADGKSHEEAMLGALRYALTSTWDDKLERPWTSDLPNKTRETLIRSIIWYLTQFEEDTLRTVTLKEGEAAVELPFHLRLEQESGLTGEEYSLCGYIDRAVVIDPDERRWITDWKSTRYALDEKYFAQYTPNNQVSQYSFAANMISGRLIEGVIIDAVQLGVTFSRFQRERITRTKPQLDEWVKDAMHYIRQNEDYVANDYWPQNDTSCDKYNGCPYRTVCAASPEVRPKLLEGLFHRRTWDPLTVREV